MQPPHVRLSEGQVVYYTKMPQCRCIIEEVHDSTTPVVYVVRAEMPGSVQGQLHFRGIPARDLRAVDEISL